MRSPLFVVAALAALVSTASSRATHRTSKRASRDTCANLVNQPLSVTISPGIPPVTIGLITTCLCTSGIPNFESTNVVAMAAVAVAGAPATNSALQALITSHGSECSYPDNAVPTCTSSKPCGFTCSNGFTATETDCTCPAPSRVCNGVCGNFASCPSAVLTLEKRDEDRKRAAFKFCNKGLTACGVYGSSKAWDCVDTQNDIESCGGCAVPLTLGSPIGADCTTIPGVADVSCVAGSCAVHRCLPGYLLSADGTFCIRKATLKNDPLAFNYGLEHTASKLRVWKGARDA